MEQERRANASTDYILNLKKKQISSDTTKQEKKEKKANKNLN